jgi:hypothetical protein
MAVPPQTRDKSRQGANAENGLSTTLGLADFERRRANSSDIAEERGPLVYPTSKAPEGKILRPQYKEILRGSATSFG